MLHCLHCFGYYPHQINKKKRLQDVEYYKDLKVYNKLNLNITSLPMYKYVYKMLNITRIWKFTINWILLIVYQGAT